LWQIAQFVVNETLSKLADDIAALRTFGAQCGDSSVNEAAVAFCDLLQEMADDLADDPAMLHGDMPWWESRTGIA
jgi:hypothetical protein